MSQPIDEQLSAFMDGELGRDETRFLLRRLEGDAPLALRWSRYHVARQVLRRQDAFALRGDFASTVMARIEAESTPQTARGTWLRWGSGGAIAAAVAVVALIATKPVSGPEPDATRVATASPPRALQSVPADPAPQLATTTNPALAAPLVPNSPIQTAAASFGTDIAEPVAFDPRLKSYVIRHYEATGSTGQPDFVPYILLPVQTPAPLQAENR
jgi:sigma-E factor negative regulatory protein RseA